MIKAEFSRIFCDPERFTDDSQEVMARLIVPLEHYNKNKNVHTIMLEINRNLYLEQSTNDKSEKYLEIKKSILGVYKTIKKCFNQLLADLSINEIKK
jgi:hypothetical protein